MSGFLGHLVLRSMGAAGTVKARLPVRYEAGLDLQAPTMEAAPGPFERTTAGVPHTEPDRMRARPPVGDEAPRPAADAEPEPRPRPAFIPPPDRTAAHPDQHPMRNHTPDRSGHQAIEHADHGASWHREQAMPLPRASSCSENEPGHPPATSPRPVPVAGHSDPHEPPRGAAAVMALLAPTPAAPVAATRPPPARDTPHRQGPVNPPSPATPSSADSRPPTAHAVTAPPAIAVAAPVGLLVDPPCIAPRATPRHNVADTAASAASAPAAPSVHVTIGRIELRSAAPAPAAPRATAPRPTVDLRDYLRRRNTPDQR